MPGPGYYNLENVEFGKASYIVSTMNSIKNSKFLRNRRPDFMVSKNNVPGPGTYSAISEFGYYKDDRNFKGEYSLCMIPKKYKK